MKSAKPVRRKAASRMKVRVYSTSEARANFAQALEAAHVDKAVIGFDRYGRTIAALVPVEAIYILASKGHLIERSVRAEIAALSQQFIGNVPGAVGVIERKPAARGSAARKSAAKKGKAKRAKTRGPRD